MPGSKLDEGEASPFPKNTGRALRHSRFSFALESDREGFVWRTVLEHDLNAPISNIDFPISLALTILLFLVLGIDLTFSLAQFHS